MASEPITLFVDQKAAKVFRKASPEEQKVFGQWFAERLGRATGPRGKSLDQIMDEIGFQAQRRGIRPEI